MLKKLTLLFLLLTSWSCKHDVEVKPKETLQKIKVSSLEREPYLKEVLDRAGFVSSKNGRVNGDMAINTDAIIMTLQKDDRSYCYTFAIENRTTATTFTNLIFKRVVGGVKAFYLKYESENLYPFNLSHFTGKITSYDLGFNEITVQYFSKGNLSSPKSGRVQGCQPSVEVKRECLTQDGKSTTTGKDLPCLYGTTHVIYLDYSGCLITDGIGVAGGNLPSQYTQWSNGTFVPTQWFNDGGPGGGPGGGGSGSCGGNGVTTPSSGTDPNACSDNIGVYVPSPEELYTLLLDDLYKIKVDTSVTNHPKANCIYNKLGGNRVFQELIHDFEGSALKLSFVLAKIDTANGLCRGQYPFDDITIMIDRKRLESRRTIEAARTFLHEAIHAKIFSLLHQVGGYNNLNESNFPELFNLYVEYKNSGTPDPSSMTHHQYMALKYVDIIAAGLKDFDVMNQSNPDINMDHYRALAWGGLEKTKAYNDLTADQKQKIKNDRDFIFSWASTINCQ